MDIIIDPLKLSKATLLVHRDKRPKTDAVFIHGSSINSPELDNVLLKLGALIAREQQCPVVINGISERECTEKKLAYPGYEVWKDKLEALGVNILTIPRSPHTAAESDAILDLAVEKGWKSVTIMAFPTHILRCMLQMVFCQKRKGMTMPVYARTLETVDWQMPAKKTVLGGGVEEGLLLDQVESEYTRLVKYMDKDGQGFTPHATLEELLAFMQERDKVLASV